MRYLLDTDICVFLLRRHPEIRTRFAEHVGEGVAISVITLAELRYGAACSARPDENDRVIDQWLVSVSTLNISSAVVQVFANRKAALRREGRLIEDFDLLIGATAIAHDLIFVTNNVSHFERLQGLEVARWL